MLTEFASNEATKTSAAYARLMEITCSALTICPLVMLPFSSLQSATPHRPRKALHRPQAVACGWYALLCRWLYRQFLLHVCCSEERERKTPTHPTPAPRSQRLLVSAYIPP